VRAREVVGFLGPNGAGKSTTLRILAGFLGRTSGEVTIAGFDIDDEPIEAKKRVGYMAETVPLYPEMRVVEYLRFRAELKRVPRRARAGRVGDAMEKAHVSDVAGVLIGHLSKGYRQRVGLADALVADPPILILDEPTSGLDPNQIRDVRSVVRELGRDHAVLLSTHILSEVEATCDRVLVLGRGKLLAAGPTAEIRSQGRTRSVDVLVRGDRAEALRVAAGVAGVAAAESDESDAAAGERGATALRCTFAGDVDPGECSERLVDALVGAGLKVRELRPSGGGLEEVFAELTRDPLEPHGPVEPARANRKGPAPR
jgi:ABC-2 type transport system ATP-binding protein